MKTFGFIAAAAVAIALAASCGSSDDKDMTAKLPAKSEIDSVSYLIGMQAGFFIKNNNFGDDINLAQIKKGVLDVMNSEGSYGEPGYFDQFKINPEKQQEIMMNFVAKRVAYVAEKNGKVCEAFLEKNKMEDGVVVTESGLQYRIIEDGNDVKPQGRDTVYIHYTGTLVDGTQFDASNREKDPVRMYMNRIIKGMAEGLSLVGEGGHIQLFIPADLAYGQRTSGQIEPNSALIFDVELHEVHPYVEKPKEVKKKK